MSAKPHEKLKTIRFAGELLPKWAQLLDVAARLCPVSEEARRWFSHFTYRSGVDDARTILVHCLLLREHIQKDREFITMELRRSRDDGQPAQILGGWIYALDTMIQQAKSNKTCAWTVEGTDDVMDDTGGGDIKLRRV